MDRLSNYTTASVLYDFFQDLEALTGRESSDEILELISRIDSAPDGHYGKCDMCDKRSPVFDFESRCFQWANRHEASRSHKQKVAATKNDEGIWILPYYASGKPNYLRLRDLTKGVRDATS